MKALSGAPIQIAYKPFRTVSSPTPILASQELFVSFAENGAVMSVLRMRVPPEIGSRLRLNVIENTEIWSLTVNDVKQSVYTDDQNGWIIPLVGGQSSLVELALLHHGEKLGLHGVLEAVMPETGLASRELILGIALPERVNLLSLEGAVAPAGMTMTWDAEDLITRQDIGIVIPEKLNPGPLTARITFFAPVCLLFFFILVLTISILYKVNIHPVHCLFVAAGFFAFHLLLAYMAGLVNIHAAFIVSEVK